MASDFDRLKDQFEQETGKKGIVRNMDELNRYIEDNIGNLPPEQPQQAVPTQNINPPNTPTPTQGGQTEKTVGDLYKEYLPSQNTEESEYEKILKEQMKPVDEEKIYQEKLKQYQAEIDALNQVYSEKKAEERVRGQGRIGQTTAVGSRRGLIGSDFGIAQKEKTSDYNQSIIDAIQAEQSAKIQGILSNARNSASEEAERATQARLQGAQAYQEYLVSAESRKRERLNQTALNLIYNDVEADDDLFAQLAKDLGVSVGDLTAVYNQGKYEYDQERASATPEGFTLKSGEARYDAEGNLIAGSQSATDSEGFTLKSGERRYDSEGNLIAMSGNAIEDDVNYKFITEGNQLIRTGDDGSWEILEELANPKQAQEAKEKQEADFSIVTDLMQKRDLIDELLTHKGKNSAVGPTWMQRIPLRDIAGAGDDFRTKLAHLIDQNTMDALSDAKKKGATFGAMSEEEWRILSRIGTDIGKAQTKSGNVDLAETDFDESLKRMREDIEKKLGFYEEQSSKIQSGNGVNQAEYNQLKQAFDSLGITNGSFEEAVDTYGIEAVKKNLQGFNKDLSMSQKGTDVSGIKDFTRVSTVIGDGTATGIESGSKFWKPGYDFVLDGGKNADVKSPFSGTIVDAGKNGDWGNTVKVKMDNGEMIRLSHLDNIRVKKGQRIPAGTIIGKQGNSGKTYGKTGIHVDITMYKPNGGYYTSQEVASRLQTKLS